MQLGEIIANTFAVLLLICFLAIVFFLFGKPLWPDHYARMSIILPVDAMTTASVRRAAAHPHLPDTFDMAQARPRPSP
ncbi:polymerase [Mesorhizobium sp. CA13]|uniref:polymerase n=1 Tax=Mesorhizobium sp. CA13 TaxID=2876643 RepID=UPI001CCE8B34|nr:polymerase [Mesorhizobium sp. CA13]MBZ9857815.1 polymerase [Mesorhizobium sp. CA13]